MNFISLVRRVAECVIGSELVAKLAIHAEGAAGFRIGNRGAVVMTSLERFVRLAGIAGVACGLVVGCAGEGAGLRRFQPGRGSLPAGGTNPYVAMRPTYETPQGRRTSRPLYSSGYAGYNYNRATNPRLVESSYDGRYYRSFFQRTFGGG